MSSTVINVIELVSIIIGAGFGIAGAMTETKNDKGRLTKWGVVAIAGIVISNSFSFIQSFLKQLKENNEKIEALREQSRRDSAANIKYVTQVQMLTSNLNRADSSLKQQLQIQSQTESVLHNLDESIELQQNTFEQSKLLNLKQGVTLDEIEKTINPIFPCKINIQIIMAIPQDTLTTLTFVAENLNRLIRSDSNDFFLNEKSGLKKSIDDLNHDTTLNIFPESRYFDIILSVFKYSSIGYRFSKNNLANDLEFNVPTEIIMNKRYLQPRIEYSSTGYFELNYFKLPLKTKVNLGYYSVKDLYKSDLDLYVNLTAVPVDFIKTTFLFPPDFTNAKEIFFTSPTFKTTKEYSLFTYHFFSKCDSLSQSLDLSNF